MDTEAKKLQDKLLAHLRKEREGAPAGYAELAILEAAFSGMGQALHAEDYERGRDILIAIGPLRGFWGENADWRAKSVEEAIYFCAAFLKNMGAASNELDDAIVILDTTYAEEMRKRCCELVTKQKKFAILDQRHGRLLVATAIRVASIFDAARLVSERDAAIKQLKDRIAESNPALRGSPLPQGGSFLTGKGFASVHFGSYTGGGSVTVVNGRLSVIFPK